MSIHVSVAERVQHEDVPRCVNERKREHTEDSLKGSTGSKQREHTHDFGGSPRHLSEQPVGVEVDLRVHVCQ